MWIQSINYPKNGFSYFLPFFFLNHLYKIFYYLVRRRILRFEIGKGLKILNSIIWGKLCILLGKYNNFPISGNRIKIDTFCFFSFGIFFSVNCSKSHWILQNPCQYEFQFFSENLLISICEICNHKPCWFAQKYVIHEVDSKQNPD